VQDPTAPTITPEEWQELRAARLAAIQANPDLSANQAKLVARMKAFEDKVDAAMVKQDPNMAAIIDKVEAGRQRQAAQMPPGKVPAPGTTPATK
jgi:hypothetical protein